MLTCNSSIALIRKHLKLYRNRSIRIGIRKNYTIHSQTQTHNHRNTNDIYVSSMLSYKRQSHYGKMN